MTKRYRNTYNLGTAVEGRVGSLTLDQDSQAFPTQGDLLWSLQSSPLRGHFPPPTQAGQHSNLRSGGRDPDLLCTQSQVGGRKGGEHTSTETYSAVHSHCPVMTHEKVGSGLGTATGRQPGRPALESCRPRNQGQRSGPGALPARRGGVAGPARTNSTDFVGGNPGPGSARAALLGGAGPLTATPSPPRTSRAVVAPQWCGPASCSDSRVLWGGLR